ncbi:MAG: hypothetical protein COT91_04330 [Candidatus Doudnabacteria bacterium CG10_big_fil_rev_8_21_14_0_10_41_10]|uniref:Uncharacterized protein n=1 Tax=Candidatus Doudnabacteria bacterium CG10_big_fil_rev_8_21_14_0_10_41_10 TaxID=1974551 RepID=A0A2H0VCR5_9BACT|nr:MAG: hypothetical protein COT91_04330 [Candidatus Doudnabacteria bacterium CG10_big_fil_rev_8_21_14_0_10_41_10]
MTSLIFTILVLAGLALVLTVGPIRQAVFSLVSIALFAVMGLFQRARLNVPAWLGTAGNFCVQVATGVYPRLLRIASRLIWILLGTLFFLAISLWAHNWSAAAVIFGLWAGLLAILYYAWSAIPFLKNRGPRKGLGMLVIAITIACALCLIPFSGKTVIGSFFDRFGSELHKTAKGIDPDSPVEMEKPERQLREKAIKGKIAKYEDLINALEPKAEQGELEISDLDELKQKRGEIIKLNQELKNLDSPPSTSNQRAGSNRATGGVSAAEFLTRSWSTYVVLAVIAGILLLIPKARWLAYILLAVALLGFAGQIWASHSKASDLAEEQAEIRALQKPPDVRVLDGGKSVVVTVPPQIEGGITLRDTTTKKTFNVAVGDNIRARATGKVDVGKGLHGPEGDISRFGRLVLFVDEAEVEGVDKQARTSTYYLGQPDLTIPIYLAGTVRLKIDIPEEGYCQTARCTGALVVTLEKQSN